LKKNKILSVVATVIIIAGGLTYLVTSSLGESMIYYKTVAELLDESEGFVDRPVRINGTLKPGSIRSKPGTNQYRFYMEKRDRTLEIEYRGVLPDSMQDGRELVVQGSLQSDKKLFIATEILTKCPSKYEAKAKAANL
jgi:cytochrome c-type biogenesis protein CcmE